MADENVVIAASADRVMLLRLSMLAAQQLEATSEWHGYVVPPSAATLGTLIASGVGVARELVELLDTELQRTPARMNAFTRAGDGGVYTLGCIYDGLRTAYARHDEAFVCRERVRVTASTFTWVDASDRERRKVLDAIDQFKEATTREEPGLGTIRDAFANHFFPGASTLQTRARYFLFISWMYRSLEARGPVEEPDLNRYRPVRQQPGRLAPRCQKRLGAPSLHGFSGPEFT